MTDRDLQYGGRVNGGPRSISGRGVSLVSASIASDRAALRLESCRRGSCGMRLARWRGRVLRRRLPHCGCGLLRSRRSCIAVLGSCRWDRGRGLLCAIVRVVLSMLGALSDAWTSSHGYPSGMGLMSWRDRVLARIDATADRLDARAVAMVERGDGDGLDVEPVPHGLSATSTADAALDPDALREPDALRAWHVERAARWGDDHDDLARRAAVFGMVPPVPRPEGWGVPTARGVRSVTGRVPGVEFAYAWGHPGVPRTDARVDVYAAWRNRILLEEACAAKVARGERLTATDRVGLKAARLGAH